MIKVENIKVYNIARAIYSARNAHESWDKSDSDLENDIVGENDLELAKKLYKAGSSHRKYLRQCFVTMDVTAPLYIWKEISTYKVGTVTNSCSTIHSIHKKEFTLDDFSHEHLEGAGLSTLLNVIERMNTARKYYIGKYDNVQFDVDKQAYWWEMIQLLPSSYNQMRTLTMNYENAVNIIQQRTGHKLDEWKEFVKILSELPYLKEIMEDNYYDTNRNTSINIKGK